MTRQGSNNPARKTKNLRWILPGWGQAVLGGITAFACGIALFPGIHHGGMARALAITMIVAGMLIQHITIAWSRREIRRHKPLDDLASALGIATYDLIERVRERQIVPRYRYQGTGLYDPLELSREEVLLRPATEGGPLLRPATSRQPDSSECLVRPSPQGE